MTTPPPSDPDGTVRLGKQGDEPAAPAFELGPVRRPKAVAPEAPATPEPRDTPAQPATPEPAVTPVKAAQPEHTVQLVVPAQGAPEPTVQLVLPAGGLPEQTVRLGAAAEGQGPDATVQLRVEDAPGMEATVRLPPKALAAPPGAEELTVRLDETGPVAATVRLDGPAAGASAAAPVPVPADSATFLDPEAWPSAAERTTPQPAERTIPQLAERTVPQAERTTPQPGGPAMAAVPVPVPAPAPAGSDAPAGTDPAGPTPPDGLRRFGPGVPPQAAAVWHGAVQPEQPAPPRKRRRRWLILPLLLLLAVLAYLAWQRYGRPVVVASVTVQTDAAGPACDGTQAITAAVETTGGAGDVRYRWLRSDGTDSGELVQHVPSGHRTTDLVLRWSFHGQGSMDATATLEILSPDPRTAAVSFTYTCR
ncbi:hypothetical protein [Kitasatospora sp. NPDC088346]|uniref:hypothetical protein n=1 Tax=Kitasatospora sp. NPDC088346 TaxID=3364073 RepID=UPI003830FA29